MLISNMSRKLKKKLMQRIPLLLILPLIACSKTQTTATDVSCYVFCDFQYSAKNSEPEDIVQAKVHNARREAIGCAPKQCLVDVGMLKKAKASQEALGAH